MKNLWQAVLMLVVAAACGGSVPAEPADSKAELSNTPASRHSQASPSPTPVAPTTTQTATPVGPAFPAPATVPTPEPPADTPISQPSRVDLTPTVVVPSPTPISRITPTPTVVHTPEPPTETPTFDTPLPTSTVTASALSRLAVEEAFPELSMRRMTALAFPEDGGERLYVALQAGIVEAFSEDPAVGDAQNFLDIRERVNDRSNEEGLLGLAFDPSYSENGYLYVYYTASDPKRSVVSRFEADLGRTDVADPSSEIVILEVPQPFSNHNGGQIAFGPDGFLYVALGDGGSSGDPDGNGQNTETLLGSILRIDVAGLDVTGSYSVPRDNPFVGQGSGARQEIWAYGLRNPWRFSFDSLTGDLWAADVGQNRFEEVDLIKPGRNYGWTVMEGYECFNPSTGCGEADLEPPVAVYSHEEGCSVTGGYVYRGQRLPSLYGAYVYGDFCSGKIWALRYDGAQVTEHIEVAETDLSISSFGQGREGEMYILSFDGRIYRFVEP